MEAFSTVEWYLNNIDYGNHSADLNIIYGSLGFEPNNIWMYVKGGNNSGAPFRLHPDEYWAVPLGLVDTVISNINTIKDAMGTECAEILFQEPSSYLE